MPPQKKGIMSIHGSIWPRRTQCSQEIRIPSQRPQLLHPKQPTAVVLVGRHLGVTKHALVWVQRLFPHYKNFIFLAVGEVDAQSCEGQPHLRRLQETIETS